MVSQCPLKRQPTNKVPVHYVAQVQTLLEVCDLETADFVQYKPASCFGESTFIVTRVTRDRDWFTTHWPLMEHFIRVLRQIDDSPDTLGMLREDNRPRFYARKALFPSQTPSPALDRLTISQAYLDMLRLHDDDNGTPPQTAVAADTVSDLTISQAYLDTLVRRDTEGTQADATASDDGVVVLTISEAYRDALVGRDDVPSEDLLTSQTMSSLEDLSLC